MEAMHKKIVSIWKKEKFTPPNITYALDKNDKVYIVARDHRSIVTLVVKYTRAYTFVIPKAYLDEVRVGNHRYYRIKNTSKLNIISCTNQVDELADFVALNIINKI